MEQEDWARELCTDESKYSLNTHSNTHPRNVFIWRLERIYNLTSLVRKMTRSRTVFFGSIEHERCQTFKRSSLETGMSKTKISFFLHTLHPC